MQNSLVQEGIIELQRYQKALEGNKKYVEQKTKEDPKYFEKLAEGQNPKYLLIGCSDSRAPPNELTQTDPGEIFIHRNIANLVIPTDLNINCVIQYAVEHLKVQNIIIMGHTKCGGVKAALAQDSVGGLLDLWLNQIKGTYEKHQTVIDQFINEDDKVNCLCCLNVREQVMNVWKNPIIQKSWETGHPIMVHGWLFRVETGLIEELALNSTVPEEVSRMFRLNFKKDEQPKVSSIRKSFQRMQSQIEEQYEVEQKQEIQQE